MAFASEATNLAVDLNNVSDVFVRNRATGETRRVSVFGNPYLEGVDDVERGSWNPAISADGNFIAFEGLQPDFLSSYIEAIAYTIQVFVYDWQANTVTVASIGPVEARTGGYVYEPGKNDSLKPTIAATTDATGQPCYIVAFESLAEWDGLPLQSGGLTKDVFVYNQCLEETSRIVLNVNGDPVNDRHSMSPSISAATYDGISNYSYYIAFQSWAEAQDIDTVYNFPNDYEGRDSRFIDSDVFIYFIDSSGTQERIEIVSVDNSEPIPISGGNGAQFRGDSLTPVVSMDSCYVVFKSRATNLEGPAGPSDNNFEVDVFTRYRCGQ